MAGSHRVQEYLERHKIGGLFEASTDWNFTPYLELSLKCTIFWPIVTILSTALTSLWLHGLIK